MSKQRIVSRIVVQFSSFIRRIIIDFNRNSVAMEINKTTMKLTWFLYGFAPYTIVRNIVNQIVDIKLNRVLYVVGLAIMIALTLASNYALVYYYYSKRTFR